jgi:hypothetical protein
MLLAKRRISILKIGTLSQKLKVIILMQKSFWVFLPLRVLLEQVMWILKPWDLLRSIYKVLILLSAE